MFWKMMLSIFYGVRLTTVTWLGLFWTSYSVHWSGCWQVSPSCSFLKKNTWYVSFPLRLTFQYCLGHSCVFIFHIKFNVSLCHSMKNSLSFLWRSHWNCTLRWREENQNIIKILVMWSYLLRTRENISIQVYFVSGSVLHFSTYWLWNFLLLFILKYLSTLLLLQGRFMDSFHLLTLNYVYINAVAFCMLICFASLLDS